MPLSCTLAAAAAAAAAKLLQSCPTLCNPVDSSPPGSSIHGILQARVLEWGAIAFSGTIPLKMDKMVNFTLYMFYHNLKKKKNLLS